MKVGIFAVILLFFFSFNTIIIPNAEGFGYDIYPEWINLFDWVNQNLPNGSVITAWWDYGHWLNYFNGDKIYTSLDNIQDRKDVIYTVASAFTHTPLCKADRTTQKITCDTSAEALENAEIESLSLLKPLKTTHILIDKEIIGGVTGGKFSALEHIANNYIGCMQNIGCGEKDGNIFCLFGKNAQGQDVGLTFTGEQWNEMLVADWPGISLTQQGLPTRIFARNDSGGPNIYMSALGCGNQFQPDPNAPVLYGFIHRLFFRDQNLKHVKLVYEDGWNVIYEVDWTGIPDPKEFTQWTKERSVLCTGEAEQACKEMEG